MRRAGRDEGSAPRPCLSRMRPCRRHQPARWAASRCTGPGMPFSSTGPMSREVHAVLARGRDHLPSDQHLARPGVVRDPRRNVHGLPEVVTLLEEDRPGVQADVRGRQPGRGHAIDHVQRRHHARSHVAEVDHHAVAQPLHRAPAVVDRRALHQRRQPLRQVGRGIVAALVGEPRVAGDVQEADRRRSRGGGEHAGSGQRLLEAADDVVRPGVHLPRVPQRHQGLVRRLVQPHRLLGRGGRTQFLRAPSPRQHRLHQVRAPGVRLCLGHAPQAVTGHPQPSADRYRSKADIHLGLDERDHRELALAHAIAGLRGGSTGALPDLQQQLQRQAGALADLLERLVAEGGEARKHRRVHEVQGEDSRADAGRQVLRADPRALQGPRHLRPTQVAHAEPIIRIGHQDAQLDQPIQIGAIAAAAKQPRHGLSRHSRRGYAVSVASSVGSHLDAAWSDSRLDLAVAGLVRRMTACWNPRDPKPIDAEPYRISGNPS